MKKIVAMLLLAVQMAVIEWDVTFHLSNRPDGWLGLFFVSIFGVALWIIILAMV